MLTQDRPLVEVAVDSLAAAEVAVEVGADRLELCQDLELGGVTPSLGLLEEVRGRVRLPIFAMLRPRAGDFVMNHSEISVMLRDLVHLKAAGVDGLVVGALTADGAVDEATVARLVRAAAPLPVTFHRAFDLLQRPLKAIEQLEAIGVERILTAGGAQSAHGGRTAIARYVRKASPSLTVVAGGGVTGDHVVELVTTTKVREIHLSGTYQVRGAGPADLGHNTVPNLARLVRLFEALSGEMVKGGRR